MRDGDAMTVSAVARRLKKCEATIRHWTDRGILRAIRTETGTRIVFRDEVERVARERGL